MNLYNFKAYPKNGGEPVSFLASSYKSAWAKYPKDSYNVRKVMSF